MTPAVKIIVGVIAAAVVLGIVGVPWWVILALLVGVPVAGYLMLDSKQRQRLLNSRKQIGS